MRTAQEIVLTDAERKTLQRWSRGRSTPMRLVVRAKIVLMAAEGLQNRDIAGAVETDSHAVGRWRKRFAERRLAGIEKDAPRSGRRPVRRNRVARKIVERTTQALPEHATHWSVRTLAALKEGPGLGLRDENGKTRAMLGVTKDGSALGLFDENGNPRAEVRMDKHGPALDLLDDNGKVIWKAP